MVTDYIRDAFSLPENFSYYTQKIIFIQILTRGKILSIRCTWLYLFPLSSFLRKFLVLKGEKDDHILNLRGITNQLKSDGSIDLSGESGSSYHYSRRSLMTFSFLEMLVQARIQINSEEYRSNRSGFGKRTINTTKAKSKLGF
jgi:hypothetical protein